MRSLVPPGTPDLPQDDLVALVLMWREHGPAPIIKAIERFNEYPDVFMPQRPLAELLAEEEAHG